MRKNRWVGSHVIVAPRNIGDCGNHEREYKKLCDAIIEQVRRHVDNVGYAVRKDETVAVCSFCGYRWTEDDDNYNGGCCDQDEANNPSLLKEAKP